MQKSDRSEQRINEAIAAYLAGCDAGTPPERKTFLERHADIADSLRVFLDDHDRMRRAAPVPRAAGDTATLSPGVVCLPSASPMDIIKYFGDYEVLSEIARGGMGVVYRAKQVSLNRLVAVKMILAGELASPADVQRFHTEAQAAAGLDHPNIVPIYEVGEHAGQHYFTMKLVEGGTLASWIADYRSSMGNMSKSVQNDIAQTMAALARAVHYAHQRGILHRDLKPGNVLLSFSRDAESSERSAGTLALRCASRLHEAVPMITDFGLAKRVEGDARITQSGAIVGTLSYMAPEQARSEKSLTTAVDVYSLGAILYELLSGRPPFAAETSFDTLMQVLESEPRRLCGSVPGIDRDLETICLKCLDKDPARRYGAAEALADDLDRWLHGDLIHARPSRPWERAVRWLKRRPAVAALAVICVLALAALLVEGVLFRMRLREKSEEVAARQAEAEEANDRALRHEAATKNAREEADRIKQQSMTDARAAARQASEVLGHANVAAGWRHVDVGDYRTALTLFTQALKLEAGDPHRADVHRVRVGTVLQRFGRLTQVIDTDAEARRLALSPDGKHLAVGTLDFGKQRGSARVWDLVNGRWLFAPLEHDGGVADVEFSSDGKYLLTRSFHWATDKDTRGIKSKARLWRADTGQPVTPWLEHQGSIMFVGFRADGKRFLTASHNAEARNDAGWIEKLRSAVAGLGCVKVWETASGRLLHTLPCGSKVVYAAFMADGNQVVVAGGKRIAVHQVDTGEIIHVLAHKSEIESAALNRWNRLVTGSRDGESIIWDLVEGKRVETQPVVHPASVEQISHEAGGAFLTRSKYEVRLFNEVVGPTLPLSALKHDEFTLFSSSDAQGTGVIAAGSARVEQEIYHAAFSPDGRRVITAGTGGIAKVWDATTGKMLLPPLLHEWSVFDALFTPDGRGVITACGDRTIRIWDVAGAQPILEPLQHERKIRLAGFLSDTHAYSTSGEANAATKQQEYLRFWDVRTGKAIGPPLAHQEAITSVAFRPEDRRAFSVTQGGNGARRLWAWDPLTGASLPTPVKHGVMATLVLSANGRYLLEMGRDAAISAEAKIWDLTTGNLLGLLSHDANILSGDIDVLSRFVFSVSGKDAQKNEVHVWDLQTMRRRFPPVQIGGTVGSVAINRNARRMLIHRDKERIVVSTETGELLAHIGQDDPYMYATLRAFDDSTHAWQNDRGHKTFHSWIIDDSGQQLTPKFSYPEEVRISSVCPNGKLLMTSCDDRTLRLWDIVPDGRPVQDLIREAELLTGYRIDPTGNLEQVKPGEWRQTWQALRAKYPARFAPPTTEQVLVWHQQERLASEYQENDSACIWHLDRMIAVRPKDGLLYLQRGLAQDRLALADAQDKVLADYSRAIALAVEGSEVFVKRGDLYVSQENWQEALADFTEALKRGADRGTILPKRGHALVKLDQWKEAFGDLDEAIRIAPNQAAVWQDRGIALCGLHRWKEAVRDHDKAIRLAPKEFSAWEELGTAQAELGRLDLAETHFKRALEQSQTATPTLCEALARLSLRRGDFEGYHDICKRLLDANSQTTDPDHANGVAWICVIGPGEDRDLARPLLLAELAVWRKPGERAYLHTLASVLYRRGKHAEAIRLLMKSVAMDGKGGDVWDHLFLAMAHHKLGHLDLASDWLKKVDHWVAQDDAARRKDPSSAQLSSWMERLGAQILRREAEGLQKK